MLPSQPPLPPPPPPTAPLAPLANRQISHASASVNRNTRAEAEHFLPSRFQMSGSLNPAVSFGPPM